MEITRTKDVNVVKFIKPIVAKFIESEKVDYFDATKLLQHLRKAIQTPNYMVWVSSENDEINGILVGSVLSSLKGDYMMIPCFFGETQEIEKALVEKAKEWTNENSLSEITIMTKFPKRFKDYGFDVAEHLLVLKL